MENLGQAVDATLETLKSVYQTGRSYLPAEGKYHLDHFWVVGSDENKIGKAISGLALFGWGGALMKNAIFSSSSKAGTAHVEARKLDADQEDASHESSGVVSGVWNVAQRTGKFAFGMGFMFLGANLLCEAAGECRIQENSFTCSPSPTQR